MAAVPQAFIITGISLWVGLSIGWICFGCVIAQSTVFFTSARRGALSRFQSIFLWFILALTTATAVFNVGRATEVTVYHWADFAGFSNIFNSPFQQGPKYLSIIVVCCCQMFLLQRCYLFGQAAHLKRSPLRVPVLVFIALLSMTNCAMGLVSQKTQADFNSLDQIDQDSVRGKFSLYEASQGMWLGFGLGVDVLLTAVLSRDLLGAIAYNSNDVNVGVSLRIVLIRLLRLTVANGMILVGLQIVVLVAYLAKSAGWAIGGVTALPFLQTVSLLSYLCSPHLFKEEGMNNRTFDIDLENLSPETTSPERPTSLPRTTAMSQVERARRKLPGAASSGREKSKLAWKLLSRPVLGQSREMVQVKTSGSRMSAITERRAFLGESGS